MVQVGTMTCYDSTNFDTTPGLEGFGSTHLSQCGGGKRRNSKRRNSKRRSSKRRSSKRRSSKRRSYKRRSSKRRRSKRSRSLRKSKSRRIRKTRRHFKRKGGASIEEGVPPHTERLNIFRTDFWTNVREGQKEEQTRQKEEQTRQCKDQYDQCLK